MKNLKKGVYHIKKIVKYIENILETKLKDLTHKLSLNERDEYYIEIGKKWDKLLRELPISEAELNQVVYEVCHMKIIYGDEIFNNIINFIIQHNLTTKDYI
jgi:hypothetical protein